MPHKKRMKLEEAAKEWGLPVEILEEFERLEWLLPEGTGEFLDEEDLARARLILELRQELGVNDEAIPVILHLLDQINAIQCRLRRLKLIA